MVETIYIFLFALTVVAALMVVFSRHAVYSALYLVTTMLTISVIYLLINAQLAFVLQIMVYAGAIMVLFVFVIMLLNLRDSGEMPIVTQPYRRIGVVLFAALLVQGVIFMLKFGVEMEIRPDNEAIAVGNVALAIMTRYFYAFQILGVMLMVAVIGAMVLARRHLASSRDAQEDLL